MISAKVIVDFGIEFTNAIVIHDSQQYSIRIKNHFVKINEINNELLNSYSEEDSSILDLNITFNGYNFMGNFVNGKLQEKEYNISNFSYNYKFIKSKNSKFEQECMALVLPNLILRVCQLFEMDTDLDISFVFLLDRNEILRGKQAFADILSNFKNINFLFPAININLATRNVKVLPKGLCNYTACMFNLDNTYVYENKPFLTKKVLILNISNFFTSCLIVDSNKLINYYHKVDEGINKIIQNIKTGMVVNYSIPIFENNIVKFIETGESDSKTELTNCISEQLKTYANHIISPIKSNINTTDLEFSSISGLVINLENEGLEKLGMSNYIIDAIQGNGNMNIKLLETPNTDNLDLLGACILSDID